MTIDLKKQAFNPFTTSFLEKQDAPVDDSLAGYDPFERTFFSPRMMPGIGDSLSFPTRCGFISAMDAEYKIQQDQEYRMGIYLNIHVYMYIPICIKGKVLQK